MTSEERREARYQRRKAEREWKKQKALSEHDDFERIVDVNNLYRSFKKCMRGIAWKESIQRYEMNELRNIAQTR
jgi:hypothetical protein